MYQVCADLSGAIAVQEILVDYTAASATSQELMHSGRRDDSAWSAVALEQSINYQMGRVRFDMSEVQDTL